MSGRAELLFVYGSLRRGKALHGELLKLAAEFLGTGAIRARLYDLGPYTGAVPSERGDEQVPGELYRLGPSGEQLRALDAIEGCDERDSQFVRQRARVVTPSGKEHEAWVYLLRSEPAGAARVVPGDRSRGRGSAPILGITTYAPREGLERFHLPVKYVHAVRRAGALPWLIPPGEPRLAELLARLDGLVLSGGGDIAPELYGGAQHPTLYAVNRERDDTEIALARAAFERELPTLGICRGCQVINVAFGGSLIEHLPDEVGEEIAHRGDAPGTSSLHAVELARDSRVASIVGEPAPRTSSSHHQALRRVAAGLEVVARAPDGTIEAVERRDHPFYLAVQWHPEETAEEDRGQQALFDALAAAAREHGGKRR